MLVLSRKEGESIIIGENIQVTVVQIERGKIRLGVLAPRDMPVNREEIHKQIHGAKPTPKEASKPSYSPSADPSPAV